MNPEDDEFSSDERSDADPAMRELRIEMIRLQAQIDQLAASARERAAEIADLRIRLCDLEARVAIVRWQRRRHLQLWICIALMYGAAIGMGISSLLRP
jgi:chromosome segregation ATPase